MITFKGIGFKYFALFMALVAIAGGVYLTFFHSSGFVKTEAVIVSLAEGSEDEDSHTTRYRATVEYTVDGQTYTGDLDIESASYKVGQKVSVLYDPKDPGVVHSGGLFGVYVLGVGVALLGAIVGTEIKKRKALKAVRATQAENGGADYPPSVPGPERKLYFVTDLGTVKAGHRLEDEQRNVLYEAKMTKFSLAAPFGFDFIDHEHGKTTPHLVGHEESVERDSLIFDNHYTFTFDGQDIWKHLRKNGISVQSSLTGLARAEYKILRDSWQIAVAVASSQNVHEEDEAAKSKLASLAPVQGFYRVTTTETDLNLLFVTLLAFARSAASDDHGGSRRILVNTVKKI